MSKNLKTSVILTPSEREFIDQNHISLTKFLHAKLSEQMKSNGSDSNPQPLEDPHHCIGESNG
jgi:ethanolamine utilization cobalamin adenosyltransferase